MLIWETATSATRALDAVESGCKDTAEVFAREDGRGAVILCADGNGPPSSAVEKRVELLFTGGRFGAQAGPYLFYVGLWAPSEYREEVRAWYQVEHGPILLECPVWEGYRFVEQKIADGCQFYALHQLSDRAALDSEARKRSRSTPWFRRLARNTWFDGPFVRILCRRIELKGVRRKA